MLAMGSILWLMTAPAIAAEPKSFPTPEEAAKALLDAAASDDADALWTIVGDEFRDELKNPDAAQERENRRKVLDAAKESMTLREDNPDTRVMVIGKEAWPMPIPIVRDARAGISTRPPAPTRSSRAASAPMN